MQYILPLCYYTEQLIRMRKEIYNIGVWDTGPD